MIHSFSNVIVLTVLLAAGGVWVELQDTNPNLVGIIVWGFGFAAVGLMILFLAHYLGPLPV